MKKNVKKLIMAAAAASLLMACTSNAKPAETKTAETESVMPESVETGQAGMTIETGAQMPDDMPSLSGAENGKVKSVTDKVIRIERISYVGNEVQSSESTDTKEENEVPEEVDLVLDPAGVNFVDMATGLVSDAPKEGDEIYAWVAPEYMASMPPQVNSYVVLTNAKEGFHMPMYTDGIEKAEEVDGSIELLDTLNNAKWTVDKSVKPVLASTGEEVDFSEIKKGDRCLLWSENFMITTTSTEMPKIKTNRVVILR